jgi:hypothetical protein
MHQHAPPKMVGNAAPKPEQVRMKIERITFPLPTLDFEPCQEEESGRLRGIAFLRALGDGLQ